ncbi:MAG: ABC transporter permease [Holophagaceae bacterium]|uniref:ABC transporter permease n=1 Tax=Candidatus Geothrix skivensis TaxID=2954439 RepID=A0A9D7XIK6_9BACT|nr:ABC transporter permease [Candidatus Geothrix skivensis]
MTGFLALFAAERVKWRKSWFMLAALLAPICQVGFIAVIFWFSESRIRLYKPGFRFWLELNFAAWNLVILPVAVALICDLSWEQEREARAWTLLLTQPVTRHAHYLVKALGHAVLVLISHVFFSVVLVILGYLLTTRPLLLMGPLPWQLLATFLGFSMLASLSMVAFHTWQSMRLPSLWVSLATALVGSWSAFQLVGVTPLLMGLPWGMAAQMSTIFERWRTLPWGQAPFSFAAALVLVVLGAFDFTRSHRAGV